MDNLYKSSIVSLPLLYNGKIRDNYLIDDNKLLIVTTDRLSAFDVVMNELIPGKGKLLNTMSNFWFRKLSHIVPNHLTQIRPESVVKSNEIVQVRDRAVVVKRLKPILIEAVVRGYIAGSGWKDYQIHGSICGIQLPKGLQQGAKLAQSIFTPAIKANFGEHDLNISFSHMTKLIGKALAMKIRNISLTLYEVALNYAITRGIIIADTKFEFGLDNYGVLHLMDEILTADSSRFWSIEDYHVGISPPSFDKQCIRDYLETIPNWSKTGLTPSLPKEIIEKTRIQYCEALKRLISNNIKD